MLEYVIHDTVYQGHIKFNDGFYTIQVFANNVNVHEYTISSDENNAILYFNNLMSLLESIDVGHIVAVDNNNAIGRSNKIPWHNKDDMSRFKQITSQFSNLNSCYDGIVIMGRTTQLSLPCKMLPNRLNIVVSRKLNPNTYNKKSQYMYATNTIEQAIFDSKLFAHYYGMNKVFIAGGESIYNQTMQSIDFIDLTYIDIEVNEPDTFYNKSNKLLTNVENKFNGTTAIEIWT